MEGCFLEPTGIGGTSHTDKVFYASTADKNMPFVTISGDDSAIADAYANWSSTESTPSIAEWKKTKEISSQAEFGTGLPVGLLRAFSMDSASSGVDLSDFRGGINRSTSFNSRTTRVEDLDRSLSISLEELMENIQVPRTGCETPNDDGITMLIGNESLPNIQPVHSHVALSADDTPQSTHTPPMLNLISSSDNIPQLSHNPLLSNHSSPQRSHHDHPLPTTDAMSSSSNAENTEEQQSSPGNVNQMHCDDSSEKSQNETSSHPDSNIDLCKEPINSSKKENTSSNILTGALDVRESVTANEFAPVDEAHLIGNEIDFEHGFIAACGALPDFGETSPTGGIAMSNQQHFTDVSGSSDRNGLELELKLVTNNNYTTETPTQANNTCRTPEYCKELSTLTLGNDIWEGPSEEIQTSASALPISPNMVKLSRPRCAKEIQEEVLYSGIVTFPGCYDSSRRPILFLHGRGTEGKMLGKLEIARFMLYLVSSAPCVTLVVVVTDEQTWGIIKEAILLFQWNRPGIISRIIFVAANENIIIEDDIFSTQCNILHNCSDLQEFVDAENLPEELGGNYRYCQFEWVQQRLDLESYVLLCEMLHHNFARNTVAMSTAAMPMTLEDTSDMLNRHRSTMTELLDDPRVRDLHETGHRFLTVLKSDEKLENQSYTDKIHSSYESVCSAIQRYVQVADERLLALERHLLVKQFEESCDRILSWASDRQDELHQKFGEVADSLNDLGKQREEFDRFYLDVVKQYAQCDCLLSEANQLSSSGFLGKVNSQARNAAEKISQVVQDMEMKKEEVETASQLYLFVDQAYSWALTGMKFVASLSMGDAMTIAEYQEQIDKYDEYMSSHPPISNEEFSQMQDIALRYNNVKCQRQCEVAQQKCNETKDLFRKRRRLLAKARDHQLAEMRKRESQSESSQASEGDKETTHSEQISASPPPETECSSSPTRSHSLLRQNSDISHKMNRPLVGSNNNNNGGLPNDDGPTETASVPGTSKHRPKKMLRKSASMSSHTHRLKIGSPMRSQEPDTHGRTKWSLAIEELITTEKEYVKSLNYIIEHYYPLMNQLDDVPQALRGKRGVVFGNIENVRDFHACQFLEALQKCEDDPARVAEVFIQHRESFGMYALYSKNKPRSDELMREHGNKFFRAKQHMLRDKMDLASYLLKPVQRMGKYALLLHNIAKHSESRFRSSLREAESLVKFQLRHGNDLLAMDSIIDCDVNLKEQGELRRQDEFLIFHGRRKYVRHIFLFDDLLLLSKPQRVHGGHDLYHYKSSYKTAEIGLTENIGETGLKFEIWFRRPMQDNVIFHSSSEQKKQAWVEEIRGILWKQALRNKANRRNEMVSMGVGSKPHLDIRLSQSPITDRSVAADKLMGGRVLSSRSRASIAVSSFDHACKRPHSTVSTSSTSSNGSLQFAPHQPASMFDFRAIVEGDEYESGSGHGSSLCVSNGDGDTIEGADVPADARPQQYVTTV